MKCPCCETEITGNYICVEGVDFHEECYGELSRDELLDELDITKHDLETYYFDVTRGNVEMNRADAEYDSRKDDEYGKTI